MDKSMLQIEVDKQFSCLNDVLLAAANRNEFIPRHKFKPKAYGVMNWVDWRAYKFLVVNMAT